MRVLVVHESLFGSTRAVAEAVADGVRTAAPDADVQCRAVDDAPTSHGAVDGAELLVVGGPTHFWRPTSRLSRAMESQYERRTPGGPARARRRAKATVGVRSWLDALPRTARGAGAAFDTRMSRPLVGGAASGIARRLRRRGYRLVAPPAGFVVDGVAGSVRTDEVERARRWGAELARTALQQAPEHRATAGCRRGEDVMHEHASTRRDTRPAVDLTRLLTTAEVVVGTVVAAVLVAERLSRRPAPAQAHVTMGPGGWVSLKGGAVAVRPARRPWGRPRQVSPPPSTERAPLWARVLSAVPLQALR